MPLGTQQKKKKNFQELVCFFNDGHFGPVDFEKKQTKKRVSFAHPL